MLARGVVGVELAGGESDREWADGYGGSEVGSKKGEDGPGSMGGLPGW